MQLQPPGIGLIALAAAAAWPAPARAQVELFPNVGYYWPVGGWRQEQDGGTGFPLRRQLSAAILGARVSVRLAPHLALEGTVGASPSQVAVSTVSGTTDYNGGVYVASARVLWKVRTFVDGPSFREVHWDLMLGGGLGVVHRTSGGWENLTGLTAPAVVLVAGFGVGNFHFMVEDFISWAQFGGGSPNQTRARLHNDLIASLAFRVPLSRR
jgi:hypothetical protein